MQQFLHAVALEKYYGDTLIFTDVTFSLHGGQRICLIGPNGTGKSTLLKVIASLMKPDSGTLHIAKKTTIGYVDQHADILANSSLTVYETMISVVQTQFAIFEQLRSLEHLFATTDPQSAQFESLTTQYTLLEQQIQDQNLYQLETKIKTLLTHLGLQEDLWQVPVGTLSGGQRIRLHLAQTLLAQPHVLLLDEPTNHLDISTIIWLNNYLLSYPYTIVLITHDERLIQSVGTQIWQLFNQKLLKYNGTYQNYQLYLKEQMQYLEQQQQKSLDKQLKLQTFVEQNKARASTAKRAQSAQKQLDKIQDVSLIKESVTLKPFPLEMKRSTGKIVYRIQNVQIGYDTPLLPALTIDIARYDRIALLGENGIGKSTLLATLAGQLMPISGELQQGHHVDVAYFEQHQLFQANKSVYETFSDIFPDAHRDIIYPTLARFGFMQEDVHLKNATLSGGEKQRLLLALLSFKQANTLLLDEPTNHLDIQSKHALTTSLQQFDGTIIFASHDREFISHLATKIIFITKNAIHLLNDYTSFEAFSSQHDLQNNETKATTKSQSDRQSQKQLQTQLRSLSRAIEQVEQTIEDLEQQLHTATASLLQEEIYSDFMKANEIQQHMAELQQTLALQTDEWEQLHTQYDKLQHE